MTVIVKQLKDKGTGASFVPVTHWDAISNKPEFFSGDYNDLINKPSISSAQVQSDWAQSNSSEVDYIKNKPNLADVATSGSYNDLTDKPTIPSPYTLPTASSDTKGGIKVGTGLSISDGVLSVIGGGTSGQDGTSSYLFIRYYSSSLANDNSTEAHTTPQSGDKYIGIGVSNTNTYPGNTSLNWSKYVGEDGQNGSDGSDGSDGISPTIQVGTVTSGATASVTNSGTSSAAVFNFVLPKGDKGDDGRVTLHIITNDQLEYLESISQGGNYQTALQVLLAWAVDQPGQAEADDVGSWCDHYGFEEGDAFIVDNYLFTITEIDGDYAYGTCVNLRGTNGTDGTDGTDGATFTPSVASDGTLSWTNDKGLSNPASVNIKGPAGPSGTLNTTYTTSQTTSSSESLAGTINLHKVAKTGKYSDLTDAKTISTTAPSSTSDDTSIPTSAAVWDAISNLGNVFVFRGTSSTEITDGGMQNPTIRGTVITSKKIGDVFLYDDKEFVWTGLVWEVLGDEGSHALKTVSITGAGALGGGGTLAADRTITHKTISRTDSTSTVSPTHGGTFTAIDSITSNTYGHITAVNTKTVTLPRDNDYIYSGVISANGDTTDNLWMKIAEYKLISDVTLDVKATFLVTCHFNTDLYPGSGILSIHARGNNKGEDPFVYGKTTARWSLSNSNLSNIIKIKTHYDDSGSTLIRYIRIYVTAKSWNRGVGIKLLNSHGWNSPNISNWTFYTVPNPVATSADYSEGTELTITTDKITFDSNGGIRSTDSNVASNNKVWNTNGGYTTLATVATSGSYTNLTDKPTTTTVKQNLDTSDSAYPILFTYNSNPTNGAAAETKYSNNFKINPSTGELTVSKVSATNGFFQTSDIRKKNIKSELDLEKCYDLIDKCSTVIYNLKGDDKEQIGMIAQEVKEFFPEIVNENSDGFLSLDYAKLVVICIRVLKDLIDKVKQL